MPLCYLQTSLKTSYGLLEGQFHGSSHCCWYYSPVSISKRNSLCPERAVHLMCLMHKTSIANHDAMSDWRCVLILHFLAPYVRRAPGHRPLCPVSPDCFWCPAPASCQHLVLCAFVLMFLSFSSFHPDRFQSHLSNSLVFWFWPPLSWPQISLPRSQVFFHLARSHLGNLGSLVLRQDLMIMICQLQMSDYLF